MEGYTKSYRMERGRTIVVRVECNEPSGGALDLYTKRLMVLFREYEKCEDTGEVGGAIS